MNEFILKSSSDGSKRTRLTRDELLAGKCFPGAENFSLDPRLRSPDDLLAQHQKPESAAQASIASFQQRYELEMQAWRRI